MIDEPCKGVYSQWVSSEIFCEDLPVLFSSGGRVKSITDIRGKSLCFTKDDNLINGCSACVDWRHVEPLTEQVVFGSRNSRLDIQRRCCGLLKHSFVEVRFALCCYVRDVRRGGRALAEIGLMRCADKQSPANSKIMVFLSNLNTSARCGAGHA